MTGNVVENAFGKGIGFLKDHSHLLTKVNQIDPFIVNILAVHR